MPPARTAVDQAVEFLGAEIIRCARIGSRALPRLVELAAGCHVSHVTMLLAVRRMEAAGRLYTRRGSGIFAVDPAAGLRPPEPAVPLTRRWQAVASAIEHDIAHGEFALGRPLPRVKELSERYGVSLPTLHRALRSLAGRAVLEVKRRRLVPLARRHRGASPTVFFAVPGLPLQVVTPREHRHEANMAAFDHACSRAGIVVRRLHGWFDPPGGTTMVLVPSLEECVAQGWMDRSLGVGIIPRGFAADTVGQLIAFARQHGKPVALLDEGGFDASLPARFPTARLRVFLMGNGSACGREIGNVLRDLGHRRLAFVQPAGSAGWSDERLAGLRQAYQGDPEIRIEVLSIPPRPSDIERRVQSASNRLERDVLPRIGVGRHPRMRELPGAVRDVLLKAAGGEWLGNAVKEPLAQLTGSRAVTAIVGATDAIALACLTALRDQGIRVPEAVSVAGFDDTPDAATNGLTSYNFDSQAAAQAMLNHILRPRRPVAPRGGVKSLEIRGFVSVRLTTATAAGSAA